MPNRVEFEYISGFKTTFKIFDKNGDGTISCNELADAMRIMGQNPTEKEVKALVDEVDANGLHFLSILNNIIAGFSGGSRIFPEGDASTPKSAIIFQFFCQKLHENERLWTPGGVRPWRPPPRSVNGVLS